MHWCNSEFNATNQMQYKHFYVWAQWALSNELHSKMPSLLIIARKWRIEFCLYRLPLVNLHSTTTNIFSFHTSREWWVCCANMGCPFLLQLHQMHFLFLAGKAKIKAKHLFVGMIQAPTAIYSIPQFTSYIPTSIIFPLL